MKRNNIRFCFMSVVFIAGIAGGCVDDSTADSYPNVEVFRPGDVEDYKKYNFGTLPKIGEDVILKIASGTCKYIGDQTLPDGVDKDNFANPGSPITNAFDGNNKSVLFHSHYNAANYYPVELEFVLEGSPDFFDAVTLIPRSDEGNNGKIQKCEIFTQSEGEAYVSHGTVEVSGGVITVGMEPSVKNPRKVKVVVTQGVGGFVSLAQIEVSKRARPYDEYIQYFTDKTCSELKPGYSRSELEAVENDFFRNYMLTLFDGDYDTDNRLIGVKTYPSPVKKARENKTAVYGILDNASGIYVEWNENLVLFVDDLIRPMTLRIVNPMKGFAPVQEEPLYSGLNIITVQEKGLMYFVYQDDVEATTRVNIPSGKVNGVFDISRHSDEHWNDILSKTSFTHLDLLGEYVHLILTTSDLRAHVNSGEKLVDAFDIIAWLEQDFMGHNKYTTSDGKSRMNETRICLVALKTDGHMFATDYYTGYSLKTLPDLLDVDNLLTSGVWGPAHELGHVNQVRPGFKWGSYTVEGDMTEVTNNVYSMYVQTTLGNRSRLMEQGDYVTSWNKFFVNEEPYNEGMQYVDVFSKLVPLWQLQLYFAQVLGYEDFYKDMLEAVRTWNEYDNYTTANAVQVWYCSNKIVEHISNTAGVNMVKFFNDYGFNLSQATIDAVAAKNYPMPAHEMRYIHDENVDLFKSNAAVTAGSANVYMSNPDVTVYIGDDSRNAVAYEVYEWTNPNKPIYISHEKEFEFMTRADRFSIKAVGADGTREDVTLNML